jgi:hypothetical protein
MVKTLLSDASMGFPRKNHDVIAKLVFINSVCPHGMQLQCLRPWLSGIHQLYTMSF